MSSNFDHTWAKSDPKVEVLALGEVPVKKKMLQKNIFRAATEGLEKSRPKKSNRSAVSFFPVPKPTRIRNLIISVKLD